MSYLRYMGTFVSVVIFIRIFVQLRKSKDDRSLIWPMFIFAFLVLFISLFPKIASIPASIFALDEIPGGRIISLLLIATILSWYIILWERTKTSILRIKFNNYISSQAARLFPAKEVIEPNMIWVVIPALNEAENLKKLLPKIPRRIYRKEVAVLVVDDGSIDNSVSVATESGCFVLSLPLNLGGGLALKSGFKVALEHSAIAIVTIDGDCQHDPEEIPQIVSPILEDKADLVIGSRYLGGYQKVSFLRSIGLLVFNGLINLLQGTQTTDCASGFRAIKGSLLYKLNLNQEQYHTAEMIIQAHKQSARIIERPIHAKLRMYGESKKGADLLYGVRFMRTVIKSWLK